MFVSVYHVRLRLAAKQQEVGSSVVIYWRENMLTKLVYNPRYLLNGKQAKKAIYELRSKERKEQSQGGKKRHEHVSNIRQCTIDNRD
eukprot:scaffold991_cov279-Chaetoceros_neogracile.AAC.7